MHVHVYVLLCTLWLGGALRGPRSQSEKQTCHVACVSHVKSKICLLPPIHKRPAAARVNAVSGTRRHHKPYVTYFPFALLSTHTHRETHTEFTHTDWWCVFPLAGCNRCVGVGSGKLIQPWRPTPSPPLAKTSPVPPLSFTSWRVTSNQSGRSIHPSLRIWGSKAN